MEHMSYCGFDCTKCPLYIATKNKDLNKLKEIMHIDRDLDMPIEKLGCNGCKGDMKNHMCSSCNIRNCNERKKTENCGKCDEFPCEYIKKNLSIETMEYLKEENLKK